MGVFVNPGNDRFRQALNSKIYVDKSELISITNERINSEQKYICVSRPRRFGKSLNLGMLAAYYSKGCRSKKIFNELSISNYPTYLKHLNKYNVIYINIQDFLSGNKNIEDMLMLLKKFILKDFKKIYPEIEWDAEINLSFSFNEFFEESKRPFVFLIDEWDCVMRENMDNKDAQKKYLDFIRNLLKDQTYVALAYMTGFTFGA